MAELPPEEVQREIAHLKSMKVGLLIQLKDTESALDHYRVKCPTCRCRILPDEPCACCVGRGETDDEPVV